MRWGARRAFSAHRGRRSRERLGGQASLDDDDFGGHHHALWSGVIAKGSRHVPHPADCRGRGRMVARRSVGAGVGVGLALLAYSVATQLWALLQESKVFQFIVAGALVILSVVTFAVR